MAHQAGLEMDNGVHAQMHIPALRHGGINSVDAVFVFAHDRRSPHMKKSRLVMVGNGMAGVRTIEELIKLAPELYDVTVFGAEPHPNYNRIMLSPVLAGEQTVDDIILNSWE